MERTMRALVKAEARPGLELREVPVPRPGPREALVRVRAASICGTDLHIYRWDPWAQGRIHPPLVVGHELCGEVVEVGEDVDEVQVGDFVSAESHIVCGRCVYCRTGRGHLCPNTRILGVDRDGGFAEYIVLPAENLWRNPPDLPVEVAVLLENFGNAVHTVFSTSVAAKKVLVTGCGPVGLMAIAVAKAAGARKVLATDLSDYRLQLARTMGADVTIRADREDVVGRVLEETGGEGVDVLLEMSGAASALDQGFQALRDGGEAALLGLPAKPIPFDFANRIIFKGITVRGIIGRRLWETWYQGRGLIASGAVDLRPLVTHRFPLERYEEAFETMASGRSGKVMLVP